MKRIYDQQKQQGYSMYGQRIVNKTEINGIAAGTHGRITMVEPGKLGSPWLYAFMADDWAETQHPFTFLTADQFEMEAE